MEQYIVSSLSLCKDGGFLTNKQITYAAYAYYYYYY